MSRIHNVALELTNSIGTLHTLTVKYAGIANSILDALLPIVKGLPIIPKNIVDMLVNLESITQKIIDSNANTATALFAPIAIALAHSLNLPPEPFAVTVAMAAVTSFFTPLGIMEIY